MKWVVFTIVVSVVLPAVNGVVKVVDLTYTHSPTTLYWPGSPTFNFSIINRGQLSKFWYETNWFSTAEHGGTHIDAPAHFAKGNWRLHQIPPERLIGPAVVIDVRSKVANNWDYRVMKADIMDYEEVNGRIPEGAIVIMLSGWGTKYPDKSLVFNSDDPDDPTTFHFPGYHKEAVEWLIAKRNVSIIGTDTPSIDYGQTTDFPAHITICQNNVPGLENLANVDKLPVKGATVIVGAIKVFDGSGGPARVLAMYDPSPRGSDNFCSSNVPHSTYP